MCYQWVDLAYYWYVLVIGWRRTRRSGLVIRSPLSLDLSLFDFFLWGCVKSVVCLHGKPDTRGELIRNIYKVAVSINRDFLDFQPMCSMEANMKINKYINIILWKIIFTNLNNRIQYILAIAN